LGDCKVEEIVKCLKSILLRIAAKAIPLIRKIDGAARAVLISWFSLIGCVSLIG